MELDELLKDAMALVPPDEFQVIPGITKRCNCCLRVKSVAEFYFRADRRAADKFGNLYLCKECSKKKTREYWRTHKAAPLGTCEICKETRKLCRDHDHKTGKDRGLLCHNCNKALGLFQDNFLILFEAAKYLALRKD